MATVISIVNQKGGVGKTTTAINLSTSLAEAGYSTLLIDLDPQANTTTGLGMSACTEKTVYDCLQEEASIQDVALQTEIPGLSLVPASIDLAGAEIELVSVLARETRLRRAIETSLARYDYVIIDSPPSLGLLTINSLAAADKVIVPVQCEFYALTGLNQLLKTLALVRRSLNSAVEVLGVALTMYDARTRLSEEVAVQLREHFKGRVFRTMIPRNIRLTEAPSHGKPVNLYAPESRVAQAYKALATEVAMLTGKRIECVIEESNDGQSETWPGIADTDRRLADIGGGSDGSRNEPDPLEPIPAPPDSRPGTAPGTD